MRSHEPQLKSNLSMLDASLIDTFFQSGESLWSVLAKKSAKLRSAADDWEFMRTLRLDCGEYGYDLISFLALCGEWDLACKATYFDLSDSYMHYTGLNEYKNFQKEALEGSAEMQAEERIRAGRGMMDYYAVNSFTQRWRAHLLEDSTDDKTINLLFDNPETRVKQWWPRDCSFGELPAAYERAFLFMNLGRTDRAGEAIQALYKYVGAERNPDYFADMDEGEVKKWKILSPIRFLDAWYRARVAKDADERRHFASWAMIFQLQAVVGNMGSEEAQDFFHCRHITRAISIAIEFDLDREFTRNAIRSIMPVLLVDDPTHSVFFKARELDLWAMSPEEAGLPPLSVVEELDRRAFQEIIKRQKKRR